MAVFVFALSFFVSVSSLEGVSLSLCQCCERSVWDVRSGAEEAVLVGRGVVQQRELRHGQILHLVDDDAVQRRVPDLALADLCEEVEDDVAHVVQPVPPLLAL